MLPHHRVLGPLRAGQLSSLRRSLEDHFNLEAMIPGDLAPEEIASVVEDRFQDGTPESLSMAVNGLEPSTVHLVRRKSASTATLAG